MGTVQNCLFVLKRSTHLERGIEPCGRFMMLGSTSLELVLDQSTSSVSDDKSTLRNLAV